MKNFWKKYAGTLIAVTLIIATLTSNPSCEPTVRSPWKPYTIINRDQLDAEVEQFLLQCEVAYKDLDRQQQFRQLVLDFARITTETGTFNPTSLIPLLAALLGIGTTVDALRTSSKARKKLNSLKPPVNP